jgi:hypothetical protein
MGYEKLGQEIVGVVAALQPGARTTTTFTSAQSLNLTNINLPLVPAGQPFDIVPLTDRSQDVYAFDDDFRAPYVQNWNFTIQRELPGKMYLQVGYAGSKGTKLARQININEVNIFETGILDAFRVTQAGGDSPLLHQIFNGLTVANTLGPVNGSSVTASQSLRMNSNTRGFFANNNVGGFADYLNTTTDFTGIAGELLRRAGLPENWIVGNPQFHQALLVGNFANSTYHGMQIELTRRSSRGWSLQANYTWSRTLGEESGDDSRLYESTSITGYRNGRDRHADKRLLPFHRTHVFRSNGMFELPFGPGKRFLNSNGVLARLFERWQFGAILNLFSGEPIGFKALTSTVNQYTNNNTADIVVALPKDLGRVTYDSAGVRYFAELSQITDPGVSALTTLQNLQTMSRLQAITTADGAVVAVNPQPGVLGNMARSSLEGPGAIRFDLNLLKRVRVGERTEFEIRADALNVLNHPNFANPNTDINSSTFGRITNTNGDSRIIVVNARINF